MELIILLAVICVAYLIIKKIKGKSGNKTSPINQKPTIYDEKQAYIRNAIEEWGKSLFSELDIKLIRDKFLKDEKEVYLTYDFVNNVAITDELIDIMKYKAQSYAELTLNNLGLRDYGISIVANKFTKRLSVIIRF